MAGNLFKPLESARYCGPDAPSLVPLAPDDLRVLRAPERQADRLIGRPQPRIAGQLARPLAMFPSMSESHRARARRLAFR